uniref:Natural killer cell receptor 2B4 immunoglobulin domain-containing protein n=1 Tax=Otus sunia TaxID=257818 RepID=A0A8C8AWQ2_9STRI
PALGRLGGSQGRAEGSRNARGSEPQIPRDGQSGAVWDCAPSLAVERHIRILTAEKNHSDQLPKGPFSGRVGFQQNNLSLWISAVGTADSGVYWADFEDTSGAVTASCFRVSQNVLHREQGWCNLSLVCAVPGAVKVSYSWTCSGDPPGVPEPQPRVYLQVHDDDNLAICSCNASNPVSWNVPPIPNFSLFTGISLSYCLVKGLLCLLVLGSLCAAMVSTHILVQRRGHPSRGSPGSLGAG